MSIPARMSVADFLAKGRAALRAAMTSSSPLLVTLVVGNESADLDSLLSALLLAYFRTHCVSPYRLNIPLANMPRADFALKAELAVAFCHVDSAMRPTDMLSIDDVLALPDSVMADVRWLLVDHNAPTRSLRDRFAHRVVGCIDHHADERLLPSPAAASSSSPASSAMHKATPVPKVATASAPPLMPSPEPHIIQKAGSCASLVTQYCRNGWDGLPQHPVDMGLALLGLAPILLDTSCLSRKVRDPDRSAIAYLEIKYSQSRLANTALSEAPTTDSEAGSTQIRQKTTDYQRIPFYQEINKAATNLDPFSVSDIIRRDYKEWAGVGSISWGISAIPADFGYMATRSGGLDHTLAMMKDFASVRSLDVLVVMTVSHVYNQQTSRDTMVRYLFVGAWTPRGAEAALRIVQHCKDILDLVKSLYADQLDGEEAGVSYHSCWQQMRVGKGRKALAPLLRQILCG